MKRLLGNQKGFTAVELVVFLLMVFIVLFAAAGWVQNIIKLTKCDFEAPYKAEVIHVIGIIPPVGAVTGWLDVGK